MHSEAHYKEKREAIALYRSKPEEVSPTTLLRFCCCISPLEVNAGCVFHGPRFPA